MAKIEVYIMICGIDAGGTTTSFVLMNEHGDILYTFKDKNMHFMTVGYEGIYERLNDFRNRLIKHDVSPANLYLVIGMAGYGNDPNVKNKIDESVHKVFPQAHIMNDAQFAHLAVLNNRDGVIAISGTGSIAYRRLNDSWDRRGGFGYLIDDAGSGFWIGKRILEIFSKQVDGNLERTQLYDFIKSSLDLSNDYEIIKKVNDQRGNYRNWVANLSELTSSLEDKYLSKIYNEAGVHLANICNSFNVSKGTLISVSGSVLIRNQAVYKSFVRNLDSNFELVRREKPVEFAAYIHYITSQI